MLLRLLLSLAVVLVVSALPFAQRVAADGEIDVRVDDVDDSAFPVVRAFIRIDQAGRPLGAVTPPQLEVTESGAPATVQSVERVVDAAVPLGLVIVVDVSGSMAGAPLENAKQSAATLIRRLGPNDGAALVTFADAAAVVQPMTSDKELLLGSIARMTAVGNTSLYAAVGTAAKLAAESQYQRRAVVLLSDGRDAGSVNPRSRDDSLQDATSARVNFYAVGFGQDIDRPYLEEVARRSGGTFFAAPTLDQMTVVFDSIESLLRSQFIVTLRSSASPERLDRAIALAVRTADGSGRAERAYTTRRSSPGQVVEATSPAPTERPAPSSPQEDSKGFRWIGIALLVVLVLGGGVAAQRSLASARRRRALQALSEPDARPLPVPVIESVHDARVGGQLRLIEGAEQRLEVEVQTTPVTVGSAASCGLRLPDAPGVGVEHARIWRHDGRVMLHHLDVRLATRVNGRPVDWTVVVDGDEIEIGPYRLRYEAQADDVAVDAIATGVSE